MVTPDVFALVMTVGMWAGYKLRGRYGGFIRGSSVIQKAIRYRRSWTWYRTNMLIRFLLTALKASNHRGNAFPSWSALSFIYPPASCRKWMKTCKAISGIGVEFQVLTIRWILWVWWNGPLIRLAQTGDKILFVRDTTKVAGVKIKETR